MYHCVVQGTVVNNRYSIVRPLGDGGMARVYLAHDEVLDRDVALKVLWEYFASDEEFVDRFKREARSAASLSHPNIVQVYDRGETENGTAYMAMEYVPGGTLKERISREGPLSPAGAAGMAIQISEALAAAHERGVIHRDIKPHNVLLSESGEAKVTDFGIARAAAATTATRTGRVLGTAGYMSPEQALGERVDLRSDLYSLGVVLFEMLTGRLPFRGESPITVSMKHVNEAPPPPNEIRPELPEGVNALVLKLLAKNPDDRYADAWDLIEDLRKVRSGIPLAVAAPAAMPERQASAARQEAQIPPPNRRTPRPATLGRRRRRRALPWLLLALLALVLVPLGAVSLFDNNTGDPGGNNQSSPTAGKVKVPDVRGILQQRAEAKLRRAGLDVGTINQFPSDRIAPGRVIEPGYPVGKRLARGTDVNLTVSSGPSQPASSSASSSASATSSASSSASPQSSPQTTPAQPRSSASANPKPAAPKVKPGAKTKVGHEIKPKEEKSAAAGNSGGGSGPGVRGGTNVSQGSGGQGNGESGED